MPNAPSGKSAPQSFEGSALPPRLTPLASKILLAVWCLSLLACWAVDFRFFPCTTLFPDESRFIASATRWAATGEFWVGRDRAWEMPLTATVFGMFYRLCPSELPPLLAIRCFQSFLLVVQSWLLFSIASRLFAQTWPAVLAAAALSFYPFFIFYQGLLLSETLFNTFLLGMFWALYRWRSAGCRLDGRLVAVMALAAAATYTKASLTFLPPLLAAATAWAALSRWRAAATVLATAAALYAGMLAPWWLRNYTVFHAFVPLSTSSSLNLYVGNNTGNHSGGNDWGADTDNAEMQRIQAIPDELVRQRAFRDAALTFIRQHPGRFVDLFLKRLVRFWNVVPNAESYKQGMYQLISAVTFGPLLALSLAGLWVLRSRWRLLLPLYLLLIYFTLLHSITIASLRYRLPLEAPLILLAAGTLGALWPRQKTPLP